MQTEEALARARHAMVAEQIVARGIKEPRLLECLRTIPRHRFIEPGLWADAYSDHPIPIGFNQTISQPYIVAFMTEKLKLHAEDRVLEIGTGCGYQTAVLASLSREVSTIEIVPELLARARAALQQLGIHNVRFHSGNGSLGWPEGGKFDAILCAAAPKVIPEALTAQLADGGRMILPVGEESQRLIYIESVGGKQTSRVLLPVRFVPMI
ncbi:MAG: protein-L-isoaspartate(D-aspartate) O-methyltransferase [Leptospirales bacterium]|nr:protein-L-isoaspartate(D-aspartate) O-methyltransferase [Leptospirales bacterium]